MKNRIEKIEDNLSDIRIANATITERVDAHSKLLEFLEESRHKHSGRIHVVEGILVGMETAVNKLTKSTDNNTALLRDFKIMAITAVFMGGGFITFCGFVGGKLLHWW